MYLLLKIETKTVKLVKSNRVLVNYYFFCPIVSEIDTVFNLMYGVGNVICVLDNVWY